MAQQDSVSPANRVAYYTNEGFYDPHTHVSGTDTKGAYAVAQITENERGYSVYSWHTTLQGAQTAAAACNAAKGISDKDVTDIVVSSMRITHADARYEFNVSFEIEVYANTHEDAAQQVADMLGEDYAQRGVYTVLRSGEPAWQHVNVDLSGEERESNG